MGYLRAQFGPKEQRFVARSMSACQEGIKQRTKPLKDLGK